MLFFPFTLPKTEIEKGTRSNAIENPDVVEGLNGCFRDHDKIISGKNHKDPNR